METELLRECLLFAYEKDPPGFNGPLADAMKKLGLSPDQNRPATDPDPGRNNNECLRGSG